MHLDLKKNSLGDEGAEILFKAIRRSHSLVHVDVSSNEISSLGMNKLFRSLKKNESVASLTCGTQDGTRRNRIGKEGADALVELLHHNSVLSVLDLSGLSVGNETIETIVLALSGNKTLVSLSLTHNDFTAGAAPSLASIVR